MAGPEGDHWMAPVGEQMVPLNCPPGLEYLTMIDQLIVKQKLEMLEAVAGVMGYGLETSNKYKIKNVLGQVSFYKKLVINDCNSWFVECVQSRGGHRLLHKNSLWTSPTI